MVMPVARPLGTVGRLNSTSVIITLQWLEANAHVCSARGAEPID